MTRTSTADDAEASAEARSGGDAEDEAEAVRARDSLGPSRKRALARKQKAASPSALAERQERKVAVDGIEGTLSSFDVRVTLDAQGAAFARCHEPRARRVPALAGHVEFQIHVLRSGRVGEVNVSASDLGDRVLERCLSDVIRAARFPSPNGGEADVTYRMLLEPAGKRPDTEQWATRRVRRVIEKRQGALLETCDAERLGPFTVTAYVSRAGRVLSAGVASRKATDPETIDCIAAGLRSWSMPRPRKAVAKVSFPLRTGA